MLEIKGKYETAKIFADIIESEALDQIRELCNLEFMQNSNIRIMPDVHPGKGCTIGTTFIVRNKIVDPDKVGVDIGCGVLAAKLNIKEVNGDVIQDIINKNIPSGQGVRSTEHKLTNQFNIEKMKCLKGVNKDRFYLSLGTLGGGNHFIELNRASNGAVYIVVHSGSRSLGNFVANHYKNEAYNKINNNNHVEEVKKIIAECKKKGRSSDIESKINKLKLTYKNTSKNSAYCEGDIFDDYINDMKITQHYAYLNRLAIIQDIVKGLSCDVVELFDTVHNYIEIHDKNNESMILRKGAVSAKLGEKLLIPINMLEGSLLCIGKGNLDWNFSAPHGAGRLMSRAKAKQIYEMEKFKQLMVESGIYTKSVNDSTLDECPMAYKPLQSIIDNITDTVKIIDRIIPIYNFKASN